MHKLFYPAVFHQDEDAIWVSFPDFPECLTQGDSMDQAYEMAIDCLGLSLSYKEDNKIELPKPSSPKGIATDDSSFIVVVEFDMAAYKKKHNAKAVKKTLSIPEWLNEEAVAMGVNFSQVLQEALLQKLGKQL